MRAPHRNDGPCSSRGHTPALGPLHRTFRLPGMVFPRYQKGSFPHPLSDLTAMSSVRRLPLPPTSLSKDPPRLKRYPPSPEVIGPEKCLQCRALVRHLACHPGWSGHPPPGQSWGWKTSRGQPLTASDPPREKLLTANRMQGTETARD